MSFKQLHRRDSGVAVFNSPLSPRNSNFNTESGTLGIKKITSSTDPLNNPALLNNGRASLRINDDQLVTTDHAGQIIIKKVERGNSPSLTLSSHGGSLSGHQPTSGQSTGGGNMKSPAAGYATMSGTVTVENPTMKNDAKESSGPNLLTDASVKSGGLQSAALNFDVVSTTNPSISPSDFTTNVGIVPSTFHGSDTGGVPLMRCSTTSAHSVMRSSIRSATPSRNLKDPTRASIQPAPEDFPTEEVLRGSPSQGFVARVMSNTTMERAASMVKNLVTKRGNEQDSQLTPPGQHIVSIAEDLSMEGMVSKQASHRSSSGAAGVASSLSGLFGAKKPPTEIEPSPPLQFGASTRTMFASSSREIVGKSTAGTQSMPAFKRSWSWLRSSSIVPTEGDPTNNNPTLQSGASSPNLDRKTSRRKGSWHRAESNASMGHAKTARFGGRTSSRFAGNFEEDLLKFHQDIGHVIRKDVLHLDFVVRDDTQARDAQSGRLHFVRQLYHRREPDKNPGRISMFLLRSLGNDGEGMDKIFSNYCISKGGVPATAWFSVFSRTAMNVALILFAIGVWTVFVPPFLVSFEDFMPKSASWLYTFDFCLDVVFFICVILQDCFQSVIDVRAKEEIMELDYIQSLAVRSGRFWTGIFSSIIGFLVFALRLGSGDITHTSGEHDLVWYAKFLLVLKLCRLWYVLYLGETFKHSHVAISSAIQFVRLCFFVLLLSHILACLWFFCIYNFGDMGYHFHLSDHDLVQMQHLVAFQKPLPYSSAASSSSRLLGESSSNGSGLRSDTGSGVLKQIASVGGNVSRMLSSSMKKNDNDWSGLFEHSHHDDRIGNSEYGASIMRDDHNSGGFQSDDLPSDISSNRMISDVHYNMHDHEESETIMQRSGSSVDMDSTRGSSGRQVERLLLERTDDNSQYFLRKNTHSPNIINDPAITLYLFSLRDAIFMMVGKDRPARTQYEALILCMMGILGTLNIAVIFGNCSWLFTVQRQRQMKHFQDLEWVRQAVSSLTLPGHLRQRIFDFYNYTQLHYDQEAYTVLFEGLSPNLNLELKLYLYADLLRNSVFFNGVKVQVIKSMVLKLILGIYSAGDYVIHKHEAAKEMFFIVKGSCEVIVELGSKPVCTFKEGQNFGEMALYRMVEDNAKRTAWVRGVTFCHLAKLTRTAFEDILAEFPDSVEQLYEKVGDFVKKRYSTRLMTIQDATESVTESRRSSVKEESLTPDVNGDGGISASTDFGQVNGVEDNTAMRNSFYNSKKASFTRVARKSSTNTDDGLLKQENIAQLQTALATQGALIHAIAQKLQTGDSHLLNSLDLQNRRLSDSGNALMKTFAHLKEKMRLIEEKEREEKEEVQKTIEEDLRDRTRRRSSSILRNDGGVIQVVENPEEEERNANDAGTFGDDVTVEPTTVVFGVRKEDDVARDGADTAGAIVEDESKIVGDVHSRASDIKNYTPGSQRNSYVGASMMPNAPTDGIIKRSSQTARDGPAQSSQSMTSIRADRRASMGSIRE